MILICPLPLWSVGGENLCMPYTLESDVQIRPSQKMPNNWEREALTRKLQIWMTSICQKPWTWTQKIPCQFWEQFYIRNEKQFPKNTVHMAFQVLYCSASSTGDKVTMNRMAGNGCKWGIQPILHVLDDDLQDVCVIIYIYVYNMYDINRGTTPSFWRSLSSHFPSWGGWPPRARHKSLGGLSPVEIKTCCCCCGILYSRIVKWHQQKYCVCS